MQPCNRIYYSTVPTQTWLGPVTTCVCKPEAANTIRAPDDERYAARNMLSLQWTDPWILNLKVYPKTSYFSFIKRFLYNLRSHKNYCVTTELTVHVPTSYHSVAPEWNSYLNTTVALRRWMQISAYHFKIRSLSLAGYTTQGMVKCDAAKAIVHHRHHKCPNWTQTPRIKALFEVHFTTSVTHITQVSILG